LTQEGIFGKISFVYCCYKEEKTVVEKVKLNAKERELTGKKVKHLRKEGRMPVVIYGKDRKPMALDVDAHDFALMFRQAGGNTIIEVEIEKLDGSKEKKNVLVSQTDVDPVKGNLLHADFLQIKMNEKITAQVPLHFVGDSIAVIDLQGSLLTPRDEVEVECLPADLPHEIEVDLGALVDFETVIHVSDLKVQEGVVVLDDPEETVAFVEAPRTDEEMEADLEAPVEEEMPESEHGEAGEEPAETEEGEAKEEV
jgi:large subunit ribosomal protein L25